MGSVAPLRRAASYISVGVGRGLTGEPEQPSRGEAAPPFRFRILIAACLGDHSGQDGVSYIFGGERELDLASTLEILHRELGIDRLLLEGGGGSNGAFPRAGLIDEITLAICPVVDEVKDAPSIFELQRQGCRSIGANHLDDADEHQCAGGLRGLAPLSAPKPLMHGGERRWSPERSRDGSAAPL